MPRRQNVVTGPEAGNFAEAVRPSVVLTLSRPVIDHLIDVEPRIAVQVARMLLARARYLGPDWPTGKPVTELRPKTSHQVLADMLGLRRETARVRGYSNGYWSQDKEHRASAARTRASRFLKWQ